MTTKEKAMPDVRDPAKWVDNCPECPHRDNPPHVVEVGARPGSIRCHYQCRECRGAWRTEYVATNGENPITGHAKRRRWGTDYGMAPAAFLLLGKTTEDTTETDAFRWRSKPAAAVNDAYTRILKRDVTP